MCNDFDREAPKNTNVGQNGCRLAPLCQEEIWSHMQGNFKLLFLKWPLVRIGIKAECSILIFASIVSVSLALVFRAPFQLCLMPINHKPIHLRISEVLSVDFPRKEKDCFFMYRLVKNIYIYKWSERVQSL